MMSFAFDTKVILFLLLCFTYTLGLDNGKITHEEFCYEEKSCGPESNDWPGECKVGQSQSPIDLPYEPHRHTRHVELEFNDQYCNNGKLLHSFCLSNSLKTSEIGKFFSRILDR